MIREAYYKDRPAIEIKNELYCAIFLPLDGAKLVSLKNKDGKEFLAQAEGKSYKRLHIDTNYVSAECSAFDDMFPTIDPCEINGIDYIDHGEVARREYKVSFDENAVIFSCYLEKMNIEYKKLVFFENEDLCVKYCFKNHNNFDFPYLWAGHIMLCGEKDASILCDFGPDCEKQIVFGFPNEPMDVLCEYGVNKEWKYYYSEAKSPMRCGVMYPESGCKFFIEFDNDIVRYLGVWMNPGDLNGMYNIALEPSTALYDSPLKAGDTCSYIEANEMVEFTLKIIIKGEED